MATKLLYLSDNFLKETTAKIVDVKTKGNQTAVTLNQTIFYPLGGGQPSDQGTITTKTGSLAVSQVTYNQGQPLHFGKIQGKLTKKTTARLTLDWPSRFHHMRLHSAGHIVHEAVMAVSYGIEPIEGMHGIKNELYVKYQGIIDRTLINQIQDKVDQIIADNLPITTQFVSLTKLQSLAPWVPANLPKNKPLRVMQIGSYPPIPDGGTQVASTADVGKVKIVDIDYDSGCSIVRYTIGNPPTQSISNLSLQQFTNQLDKLQGKTITKTLFHSLTQLIPKLPSQDRASAGKLLNQFKKTVSEKLSPTEINSQNLKTEIWFDPTIPSIAPAIGALHPITRIMHEIEDIFGRFGFTIASGPEIEWDEINFQKLLLGPDHPSRDTQETYYFDDKRLLRVHTSPVQIRYMETHQPPIRIIAPGRVYRRDQIDATHLPSFHQIEGLLVDDRTTLTDLLGILEHAVKQLFGSNRRVRFYGHHFPYTEPSLEIEVQAKNDQWLEILGCGMVHPEVLENCHIDSRKYQGWAFGMGADRLAMLKYSITDIRHLYENDIRLLKI